MPVYTVRYEDVGAIKDVYVYLNKEQKTVKMALSILAAFSFATALASTAIYKSPLPSRVRTGMSVGTAIVAALAFSVFAYIRFVSPAVKIRSQLLDFLKPVVEQDFANAIEPARKLVTTNFWNAEKWKDKPSQYPYFYTVFNSGNRYSSLELQSIHQSFMLLAINQQANKKSYEENNSDNRCNDMIATCSENYTLFKGLSTNAGYNRQNEIFDKGEVTIPKNLFANQLGKNSSN